MTLKSTLKRCCMLRIGKLLVKVGFRFKKWLDMQCTSDEWSLVLVVDFKRAFVAIIDYLITILCTRK